MPIDIISTANVEPSKPRGFGRGAGMYVVRNIGKADTVEEDRQRSPTPTRRD